MSNYDEKTGIHYGVISQNSLAMDHMDDWYEKDAVYDNAKKELTDKIDDLFDTAGISPDDKDFITIREMIENTFNDNFQNDEPHFYYEDSEYSAEFSQSLNCWIILKSPYYTFCRQCSPCVPQAGDLDNPITEDEYNKTQHNTFMYGTVKAYCLPKEFFDPQYSKIPYRYYNVSDDKEVIADIIEVD